MLVGYLAERQLTGRIHHPFRKARRFDPVLALLYDVIRQPDGGKAGKAGSEIHFDFDRAPRGC